MGGCQTGGDAEGVAASRGSDIYLSEQQSQEAKNYGYWCFPVLTRECRPDGACRCHSMSLVSITSLRTSVASGGASAALRGPEAS